MEFVIDAAELSPALRALAPITHALPKGEPEEAESCEIIYGRPTTTGKLLLIATSSVKKITAAIICDIAEWDGHIEEFAIGREKIRQIVSLFRATKDDPKPIHFTVDTEDNPLFGNQHTITLAEAEVMHSPVELTFAGEKHAHLPYRQTLKLLSNNGKKITPETLTGVLFPGQYGALTKLTETYGLSATITTKNTARIMCGDKATAIVGAYINPGRPLNKQIDSFTPALAVLNEQAELIAGTDPIEFEPTEEDKARVLKSFLSEPGEEASDEEVAEIVEGLNALQSAAQNITQDDFELAQG